MFIAYLGLHKISSNQIDGSCLDDLIRWDNLRVYTKYTKRHLKRKLQSLKEHLMSH